MEVPHQEAAELPSWVDMLPEALLAKIFSFLPIQDKLHAIPLVCSTWHHVSQDATCWLNVDLSEWCQGKKAQTYERMLLLVVNRSQGGLREIIAPSIIKDSMLQVIACSGASLHVLSIADSAVSDDCMCRLAPKFTSITYLDTRGRYYSSRALLESYGKHCPLITRLSLDVGGGHRGGVTTFAIGQNMPHLKHLELCGSLSDSGLRTLLEKCTSLDHLDLRGCWLIDVEERSILEARKRLKVFHIPVGKKSM